MKEWTKLKSTFNIIIEFYTMMSQSLCTLQKWLLSCLQWNINDKQILNRHLPNEWSWCLRYRLQWKDYRYVVCTKFRQNVQTGHILPCLHKDEPSLTFIVDSLMDDPIVIRLVSKFKTEEAVSKDMIITNHIFIPLD